MTGRAPSPAPRSSGRRSRSTHRARGPRRESSGAGAARGAPAGHPTTAGSRFPWMETSLPNMSIPRKSPVTHVGHMNDFDFAGKTVVVTGGSMGIGETFARELDARGAKLVLVARS